MIRIYSIAFLFFIARSVEGQSLPVDIQVLLQQNQKKFGLTQQDIQEYEISDVYTTKQLNISHLYLVQKFRDIRVYNGLLNLNLQGGQLLSYGNRWVHDLAGHALDKEPLIIARTAVNRSAEHLGKISANPSLLSSEKNKFSLETKFVFEDSTLSRETISTELVWLKTDQASVLLCWVVSIYELDAENIWNIFIDAQTGAFIDKDNLVIECSFDKNYYTPTRSLNQVATDFSLMPMTEDSAYNVFPLTIESPNHGDRSVIVKPWMAAGPGNDATTLNWHDDGSNNYTSTRGNNVHAYEDIDANNLPGYSPDTSNLQFIYPFDPLLPPADNVAAAITNLFYWNNILHDVMYQYGFDEVSGNFQNNNLGRGGSGVDYVRAEGLDGGGSNNANFFTPADGSKPRMQMYLWSLVSSTSPLTINSPPFIAGEMWSAESDFSTNNKLEDIGLTTGDLVLVNDAVGSTHLACGELSNAESIPGKIAVIDRGSCNFTVKVKKVQDLGAIAAIVINDVGGAPIPMGGSDNSIVIPAVMVGLDDGNLLKAVLDTSIVNASLDYVSGGIIPDGDYDSGIIAHEYGHGISTRLTGGPASSNCLNNEEQMGEGWSDFFGLMLTTDWATAQPTDLRGIGTYVLGEPTDGTGIRTYPYTTDMEINPFTYADVADAPGSSSNPSPHFVGSVWSTMLWDMTWEIISIAGVDTDIYNGTGGNNIALSLVINGLKLQPCNPGFVDGRDAILLADELLYDGLYKCAIWKAFAGRGLGVDADQGSSDDFEDGVESFATPDGISIESTPLAIHGTEGQEITFQLRAICGCTTQSDIEVKDKLSEDLTYIPGSGGIFNGNEVVFTADTIFVQDTLAFTYRAFINACSATDTVIISDDDSETPDDYTSIKLAGSGIRRWVKNNTQFVSPSHSYYAEDYNQLSDYALTLTNAANTSGPLEITFHHRYETESNYDGGVVEYSWDGGLTWHDAGANFVLNGYPASINNSGTDSPIAGRDAFTGDSDAQFNNAGFITSKIQVCSDNNQSFKIRFRFVTDGGVGGPGLNGWYIDDILIQQLSGVVNKSTVSMEGSALDSLTYCLGTSPFVGTTIYVDENADGDLSGSTWNGAMHYLPIALDVASCREADSLLIAEGTYIPNLENDPGIGFMISDSTSLFGGFPSGGSSFAMRNPSMYITALSGDLGILNDTSDNVYHIVKVSPGQKALLLDGLTLSDGNANGSDENGKGAAIFCEGELWLENISLSNNFGRIDGRIIFNHGETGRLSISNCTIYTPGDSLIQLLNNNSGRIFFLGNTQFIED